MFSRKEQQLAKRRCKMRLYLRLLGYDLPTNSPTEVLLRITKLVHKQRMTERHRSYAWPLKNNRIQELANENHYVKNLMAMKSMFGIHASIGIVDEHCKSHQCHTVADLVKHGLCDRRFLRIDDNIENLELIKYTDTVRSLGH